MIKLSNIILEVRKITSIPLKPAYSLDGYKWMLNIEDEDGNIYKFYVGKFNNNTVRIYPFEEDGLFLDLRLWEYLHDKGIEYIYDDMFGETVVSDIYFDFPNEDKIDEVKKINYQIDLYPRTGDTHYFKWEFKLNDNVYWVAIKDEYKMHLISMGLSITSLSPLIDFLRSKNIPYDTDDSGNGMRGLLVNREYFKTDWGEL